MKLRCFAKLNASLMSMGAELFMALSELRTGCFARQVGHRNDADHRAVLIHHRQAPDLFALPAVT
jgi:hypothetical protein